MSFHHRRDLLGIFAHHKVAANLLMLIMLLAGAWSLGKLNTQFFPNFEVERINVRVSWSGAAAEDVETAITRPLEHELRSLDQLKAMTSTSTDGLSLIGLEYEEGTDMGAALDQVEERVGLVRNLPAGSDKPEVSRVLRYEPVARVLVTGPSDLRELRPLIHEMERDLLSRGLARVDISGLPEEEIAIQVPSARLQELGLSLDRIGQRVAELSRDLPAGIIGRADVGRQLRSLDQRRDELGFESLPLVTGGEGRLLQLGDVAEVVRRPRAGQGVITYRGRPAVELLARRTAHSDSLEAARILDQWVEETRPLLPPGVEITVHDQTWLLIKQRISLLLTNGGGGLLLVLAILFLFLNGRVAWWVAVGIPVSFAATLAILYAVGGSVNMISLFGLIMSLGIIVDDAIVVGEDALAHYQGGEDPLQAAEGGARRMLAPVLSSSLTTVAAFLPLMLVSGTIGKILGDIPLVVVCVILASLVECFLVLPGHLRHAFRHIHHARPGRFRRSWDAGFDRFREHWVRPLVSAAVHNRWTTLAAALAALILVAGLVAGGRLGFTFFPNIPGNVIIANVTFAAGTPRERVSEFLVQLEQGLQQTEQELGGGLVLATVVRHGMGVFADGRSSQEGDRFGSVLVELVPSDRRDVNNETFINTWRNKLRVPAGVEMFTIATRRSGHPGRGVDVRLSGADPERLKAAGVELIEALKQVPGMSALEDDMPWGRGQIIYTLNDEGKALGLTVDEVGRQLRAAFDGHLAQIFYDGEDEVEVRVMLPDAERDSLATLAEFNLILPGGGAVPLSSVVEMDSRQGFEVLRHDDGRLALHVYGDVDTAVNNANRIIAMLKAEVLPGLAARYGVEYSFEGRAEDQRETLADMKRGGLVALVLIYLVLAWVFSSYGWPLVVMAAIPFGVVGAIFGHWAMGLELTILSLFGVFGLSGIVVNDSIILVTFYKRLRDQGMAVDEAIVEAACQRLRAVLLTSLTTIAGLTPLMFETDLQAQFLIPMATTITFGLGVATLLVLLVIPALLSIHESIHGRLQRWALAGL
jgi:multidrug efflux pump subunit AcrB